jgi:hypothetical protein
MYVGVFFRYDSGVEMAIESQCRVRGDRPTWYRAVDLTSASEIQSRVRKFHTKNTGVSLYRESKRRDADRLHRSLARLLDARIARSQRFEGPPRIVGGSLRLTNNGVKSLRAQTSLGVSAWDFCGGERRMV